MSNESHPVLEILDTSGILTFKQQTIPKNTLVFTKETRKYCFLPYKGHSHGCPNAGKGKNCPPNVPYLGDEVPICYNTFTFVWVEFDFKRFKELRKLQNPALKNGMAGNKNQWQHSVKKRLYDHVQKFPYDLLLGSGSGFGLSIPSCEAVGMDVFSTCAKNYIPIDRVITTTIRFFALLCLKNENEKKENSIQEMECDIRVCGGNNQVMTLNNEKGE
jgi:hypothetical protein